MTGEPTICDGCGWSVAGGRNGCRVHFDQFLARDFSDARFFATHRLLVDAYSLQHPDQFCRSAKSLAAHLVGLCWILEHEAGSSVGPDRLRRWLDGKRKLLKPALPDQRGRLTIGNLPVDGDPLQWAEALRAWAESTWAAYEPLHQVARAWLAEARGD